MKSQNSDVIVSNNEEDETPAGRRMGKIGEGRKVREGREGKGEGMGDDGDTKMGGVWVLHKE